MTKYYLYVKDIMRDYIFPIEVKSLLELAYVYKKYDEDTDYDVVSMQSVVVNVSIETSVITLEKLTELGVL